MTAIALAAALLFSCGTALATWLAMAAVRVTISQFGWSAPDQIGKWILVACFWAAVGLFCGACAVAFWAYVLTGDPTWLND